MQRYHGSLNHYLIELSPHQSLLLHQIDRERKLEVRPPRLGKAKYRPAPMQVLCSDEVSGSLRQLKPTVMLCKDVAKGIERVGAVEPRPDNYHPKRGPR